MELETVTWDEVYKQWKLYADCGPTIMNTPISLAEIHISYDNEMEEIYGYDWLRKEYYEQRKEFVEKNPINFLYFIQPTNKGTIHTIRMLVDAHDEEERAAIWLYAFASDILNGYFGKLGRYASQLQMAAWKFLSKRFYMWHHAMRKLVPEIFINSNIYEDTQFSSINAVIELARLNAALIRYEYVPIVYSSLEPGKKMEDYSLRIQ